MYKFHSVWEEYVSLTTMVAQMKHLKNPITGKSLWDSYEVQQTKEGIYEVVWIGGVRGYYKEGTGAAARYVPMEGLTTQEIMKLKKVHERMQGGYRKEEAANIEIYAMGRAVMQFKKYLPRLIINAVSSKRQEYALGTFKEIGEKKIYVDPETGEEIELDVYEWTRRINEGRWRTALNWILSSTPVGHDGYKWKNLTDEQKQNIVDAALGLAMLGLFSMAYVAFFGDEDEDETFKKWWKYYLIQNLSQQYNPLELMRTTETVLRPVSLSRAIKAAEAVKLTFIASGNLMIGNTDEAFTQAGDLKGWNEIMRSIPYLASFNDFMNKIEHAKITEEWYTETWEHKWR